MTQPEYAWTPERLIHYPLITDLDLSADGKRIVYTVREPVLTEERSKFVTHLYRVSAEGGEPLRLTYGQASNSSPRWSPDGRYIAFLSDRASPDGGGDDNKVNLHVMRADGGEAWPLTDVEKSVQALAWSPDGMRLALTMVPLDSEGKKAADKAGDDPILWHVEHERAWLWVIPLVQGDKPLPEPQALTGDDRHVTSFDWTPDSGALAFTHRPTPVEDDWPETGLAVVTADEGEPAIRELARVSAWQASCRVHGDLVACVTPEGPASWTICHRIALYPLDGGEPRLLALTPDARPYLIGGSGDGSQVYVLEASRTSSAILALPIDGREPTTVTEGEGYLSLVKASCEDTFAFINQDLDQPNHICIMQAGAEGWREVLRPALPDWPTAKVPRSRIMRWPSEDGLEIEGILTLPLGYREGRAYPTLVVVHGGPMSVFSQSYVAGPGLYPTASFAERGYAILRVNPRGSSGYGAEFRAANKRDWGGGDYADIMGGLERLIERGIADPERLGIMGWSYGGYMTSWTITQTSRFRAASVGAGVTNSMSFNGTTDISSFIPDYFDAEYWDDLELYRAHSAMFQVEGVTTPTLIQHGEKDVRVPLGQGKELYNALVRQGVEVQLVIYPRQGHGPSEPRLIMDVMRRNLDWFDRWVMGDSVGAV